MAKEICVFCGKEISSIFSTSVICGNTYQSACKSCGKDMEKEDHVERCRQAMRYAASDARAGLQRFLDEDQAAEEKRPLCLRCSSKMRFGSVLTLDASPTHDGIFSRSFDAIPLYCDTCGKIELFKPDFLSKNEGYRQLYNKDTKE